MGRMKKLKDYSSVREVINKVRFYSGSQTKRRPNTFFIGIPENVRNRLRLSSYNEYEFRVIIVTHSHLLKSGAFRQRSLCYQT